MFYLLMARVLKPDSACLVWYGIGFAPDTFEAMRSLEYRWQYVNFMPGQNQRGAYMTFSNWKGLVGYEKGTRYPNRHIRDLIYDRAYRSLPSGACHWWTKNADCVAYYLSAFSERNDVVYDPFSGSGTVPAVCKMLGRQYIAFEIDPDTANLARERIANTQPPLFVPEPEQMELAL